MIPGNVPLLRSLRPFTLIAGLMANWYDSGLFLRALRGLRGFLTRLAANWYERLFCALRSDSFALVPFSAQPRAVMDETLLEKVEFNK